METISGEDDIVEVPMDENSNEKQEKAKKEQKSASEKLEDFLYFLGLTTKSKAMELQNKRAERKRRSTANPQFVYSLLEQPIVSIYCYYAVIIINTYFSNTYIRM